MNTGPIMDVTIYVCDHDPSLAFMKNRIPEHTSVTPVLCHGVYAWTNRHKKASTVFLRPFEDNGYLYRIDDVEGFWQIQYSTLVSCPILRDAHVPYVLWKKQKVFIPQLRYSLTECMKLVDLSVTHGVLDETKDGKVIVYHNDGKAYGYDKEDLAYDLQELDDVGRMALTGALHKRCGISVY